MINDQYSCAVEGFGQQHFEYLGVFDTDLNRLHTLRPFGHFGIKDARPVGDLIFAISLTRPKAEIALIEARTGKVLARDHSDISPDKTVPLPLNGMIALVNQWSEVEFRDARTLALIWTCRPPATIDPAGKVTLLDNNLSLPATPKDAVRPLDALAEGPDARVRMPMTSSHITGVFEIDPKARSFRIAAIALGQEDRGFNGGFKSISPDGRWGIRECVDLHVAPHHLPDDKYGTWKRVMRRFELWDLPTGRRGATITAATEPLRIRHNDIDAAMAYDHWLQHIDKRRGLLSFFGRGPKRPVGNPHAARQYLIGDHQHFYWEPDSKAVWLVRHYSMMRADLTGATGPLVFPDCGLGDAQRAALAGRAEGVDLGVGETFPAAGGCWLIRPSQPRPDGVRFDIFGNIIDLPANYGPADVQGPFKRRPRLTARDVTAYLPALLTIKSWSQDAVDTALTTLTQRIATDLPSLLSGDGLTLIFRLGNSFLDEWTFFEKLADKALVNPAILRPLLSAFCDTVEAGGWDFTSDDARAAWPLTGALNALARHDETCHDILRRFCLLRSGKQETYARDEVLLGFINRLQTRDIASLRLAVFYVLLRDQDGRFTVADDGSTIYPWTELGVPAAARGLMSPQEFVDQLGQETAIWAGSRTPVAPVMTGLVNTLDPDNLWDAQVKTLLGQTG